MSLVEFLQLGELEQAKVIWTGKFLMFRHEKEYTILLYKIDSFYVEVFYDREYNSIKKLRPFKTAKFLRPYLNLNSN